MLMAIAFLAFVISCKIKLAMGMYDTIWVKCPKCGEESGFQTKSGDCILGDYTLENCPDDVIVDANRHSPNTCDCGTVFEIDVATRKVVTISA